MVTTEQQSPVLEKVIVSKQKCDAMFLGLQSGADSHSTFHFKIIYTAVAEGRDVDAYFGLRDPETKDHILAPKLIPADGLFSVELASNTQVALRLDFPELIEVDTLSLLNHTDSNLSMLSKCTLLFRNGKNQEIDLEGMPKIGSSSEISVFLKERSDHAIKQLNAETVTTLGIEKCVSLIADICIEKLHSSKWLETKNLEAYQDHLRTPKSISLLIEKINERDAEIAPVAKREPFTFIISKHSINPSWLLSRKSSYLNALENVLTFAKDHGIPAYIAYGTLLGAARSEQFIPHDDDVDVIFDLMATSKDDMLRKLATLSIELLNAGIVPRAIGANSHLTVDTKFGGVDIFSFWVSKSRAHLLMQNYATRSIDKKILRGKSLSKAKLYGKYFDAPPEIEAFLEERYGSDWKVPNPYHEWPWALEAKLA